MQIQNEIVYKSVDYHLADSESEHSDGLMRLLVRGMHNGSGCGTGVCRVQ